MNIRPQILLAEKPSQLRSYLEVFPKEVITKVESYHYDIAPCDLAPLGASYMSCRGFLLKIEEPHLNEGFEHLEKWNLDDIPFAIPRPYKYVPGTENGIKSQLAHLKKVIRAAINQYGIENITLITATDLDAAGAQIATQVYDYSLTDAEQRKVKKQRLHINSLERTEVFKGIKNLRDHHHTDLMSENSRAKQSSDWAVGLNLTRVATIVSTRQVTEAIERLNNGTALLYQQQANGFAGIPKQNITITTEDIFPKGSAARLGRCSAIINSFIFNRENEILTFKSKEFYELYANFKTPQGSYKGRLPKFKTFDQEEVSAILNKHQIQNGGIYPAVVSDIKNERKKQSAPKLHSLNTLQALANRKWKMSASQVLAEVQRLYEKKLCSYPRTSTNVITINEFNYIKENLEKYKTALNYDFENTYLEARKRYVDGQNVEEHYALILTRNIPSPTQLSELSSNERLIYDEIARTTLAMFAPDYEYDQTTITTTIHELPFVSVGKIERVRGFKTLWDNDAALTVVKNKGKSKSQDEDEDEENQAIPPLTLNQQVNGVPEVKVGNTQAPNRYNEAELLEALESAGKFVDDEENRAILKEVQGIGTAATRAEIIKSVREANYVEIEKNRYHPTPKAMLIGRMIQGTMLANPETTAKWELYLQNISRGIGNANADTFIERNIQFVEHFKKEYIKKAADPAIQKYVEALVIQVNRQKAESRVICPRCKIGEIKELVFSDKKASMYVCSRGTKEESCFKLYNPFNGTKLTRAQVMQLLTKGVTSREIVFKGKNDTEYKAKLKYNATENKINFVFADKAKNTKNK